MGHRFFTCILCGAEKRSSGIPKHLFSAHKMTSEQYWITVLGKPVSKCKCCGGPTRFINVFDGYLDCCSKACAASTAWKNPSAIERKKRISEALKGTKNGRGNKGRVSPMLGKNQSEEAKRKIGEKNAIALKGNVPWNKDKGQQKERRLCGCGCGYFFFAKPYDTRKYIDRNHFDRFYSGKNNVFARQDVKKKISKKAQERRVLGIKRKVCSEESIINRLTSCAKSLQKRPTSYESKILGLIEKHNLPYKYVGNGEMWITSEGKHMNPDFVNINGEKIVLEVYADCFKEYVYGTVEKFKKERSRLFGNFGWKVVFLGQEELFCADWENGCLDQINQFSVYS